MTPTIFLYVADAAVSAQFYTGLFELQPVEASPTFALLILPSGLPLGLWGRDGVQPAPMTGGGGSEIGFKVENEAEVDHLHEVWRAKGARIISPPTDMLFGRNFVALDPDGHRLRIYTLADGV